jgi:hypothetical protein
MKRYLRIVIAVLAFAGSFVIGAKSQQTVRFGENFALAIGTARDTLTFGVSGDGPGGAINDNTYGLDPVGATFGTFGQYGESPAPPGDPDGNRVRVVDIPGRTQIGSGGLFRYDYRGYSSPAQVDTFAARIDGLRVETSGLTISWQNTLSRFGTSWTLYSRAGATLTQVADMLTTTSYTFPATGSNIQFVVIKVSAFTADVKLIDNRIPSSYALEQNFPNPFNPSTEIRFSLPSANDVSLKVYNMIGQEVATLVNEFKPAGNYSVTLSAANLASGMYLYRLQTKGFSEVKKLILMK